MSSLSLHSYHGNLNNKKVRRHQRANGFFVRYNIHKYTFNIQYPKRSCEG